MHQIRPVSKCASAGRAPHGAAQHRPHARAARAPARATGTPGGGQGGSGLSEQDLQAVLNQLKSAEAEAARLRDELAAKEAASLGDKSQDELARLKPAPLSSGLRVDSQDARLGGVSKSAKDGGAWLSEADLNFFTGGGPGETVAPGDSGVAPEDQGTLTRRLALGAAGTALFLAIGLRPDTAGPPPKPLFFYLVPLLRVQALLARAEAVVADANWAGLASLRGQILGSPNDARDALRNASAALAEPRKQEAAKALSIAFLEYVSQADYTAYFDSRAPPTGAQNAEFAAFSLRAVKAAEARLADFLALMPADELDAARTQLASYTSAFAAAAE